MIAISAGDLLKNQDELRRSTRLKAIMGGMPGTNVTGTINGKES
jgi:hypothetical protein